MVFHVSWSQYSSYDYRSLSLIYAKSLHWERIIWNNVQGILARYATFRYVLRTLLSVFHWPLSELGRQAYCSKRWHFCCVCVTFCCVCVTFFFRICSRNVFSDYTASHAAMKISSFTCFHTVMKNQVLRCFLCRLFSFCFFYHHFTNENTAKSRISWHVTKLCYFSK